MPRVRLTFEGDNRTRRAFGEVGNSLGKMQSGVSGVAGAVRGLVTLLAGAAIIRFGHDALQAADQIGKLSDRLGASTEFLSGMKFAAEQSGVAFDQFTVSLQGMQRRINEAAHGTGEAKQALADLGIDAKKLTALNLEDQFDVIAEALAGVSDQSERVRIATKLFGEEGVRTLQITKDGAAGVRGLRDEAEQLGFTLDKAATQKAAAANDAFNRLSAAARGVVQELAVNLGPGLTAVANFIGQHLSQAIGIAGNAFWSFGRAVAGALKFVVDRLVDFADSVQWALSFFKDGGSDTVGAARDALASFSDGLADFRQFAGAAAYRGAELAVSINKVGAAASSAHQDVRKLTDSVKTTGKTWEEELDALNPKVDLAFLDAFGTKDKPAKAVEDLKGNIASALTDGITEGGEGMRAAFQQILADLAKELAKSQLLKLLAQLPFLGGGGETAGASVPSHQAGGALTGGRAYRVHQDELFVPYSSGTLYPVGAGPGGAPGVSIMVDARGADAGAGVRLRSAAQDIEARAIYAVRKLYRAGRL